MIIAYFGGGSFGRNLTPPSVSGLSFTYNGAAQGPSISGLDTKRMSVANATAVEPGTYALTISLKNKRTMTWSDTKTSADKVYYYTINKITVANPSVSNTSIAYTGGNVGPNISYNGNYATAWGTTRASAVGNYTFYIGLRDTAHYKWASGDSTTKTYTWSVYKSRSGISFSMEASAPGHNQLYKPRPAISCTKNADGNWTATVNYSGLEYTNNPRSKQESILNVYWSGAIGNVSHMFVNSNGRGGPGLPAVSLNSDTTSAGPGRSFKVNASTVQSNAQYGRPAQIIITDPGDSTHDPTTLTITLYG